MSIKCVLVFLSIHLLKQINILDAYRKPCNASLETVSRVTACPSSNSSYEAAAAEKNCLSIAADHQQCESFEYHCVLSDDMTHAVEVCAPYFNIIGSVCARFSSEYKSIIRIEGRNCNDCPFSYNSTNAFQYQECYVNLSQTFTTQLPLSATAENITAAGINDDKESNDGDSHMVIVIVILAAIFVIAVTSIVAVVKRHKIRKHFKCLKDHTDEIEMDNADHTDENEMDNADHTDEYEMDNAEFSMNRERTSEPLLPEPNTQNNDSLPDGEGATEQLLPENATNNDVSINEKTQALIEEHAKDGGSEYIEQLEENTDSPRLPKSIPQITPGQVQEGEEELRKDISDLLLNKTLMEVFHVDSIYVNLVISKVTANKGSVLVYQKDFLKSATAEDMTAEGNIEDVILKKDLPESQKIELESKFDSVLSSMKNPESMQETNLKTLVEEIVYEVIANKRIDLLTEFATTYEEEETQNALYQHGANMHRTLIPIFEDVNLILNISKKGHLMITVKDKEAYDEAVANRFRSSQVSLYVGYKFYITRALSFSGAAKWMESRKQEFAKFGFFYKGTDLSTICFHCGCLKDGWAEEDDILATHLSLTESCEYANYMISALPLPF